MRLKVEILVPDFRGRVERAIDELLSAPPDVFNHNIETVPRLYKEARPGGNYTHSLNLLRTWSERSPSIPTKSGKQAIREAIFSETGQFTIFLR